MSCYERKMNDNRSSTHRARGACPGGLGPWDMSGPTVLRPGSAQLSFQACFCPPPWPPPAAPQQLCLLSHLIELAERGAFRPGSPAGAAGCGRRASITPPRHPVTGRRPRTDPPRRCPEGGSRDVESIIKTSRSGHSWGGRAGPAESSSSRVGMGGGGEGGACRNNFGAAGPAGCRPRFPSVALRCNLPPAQAGSCHTPE